MFSSSCNLYFNLKHSCHNYFKKTTSKMKIKVLESNCVVLVTEWQNTQLLILRFRVWILVQLYKTFTAVYFELSCLVVAGLSSLVKSLRVTLEPTRVKHLSGDPLWGRLLVLLTNIARLVRLAKGPRTYTLA
jgi:hypothetical protein